jgi:diadenosine tetraphosphate (Ap4A) HIT family hydrolase
MSEADRDAFEPPAALMIFETEDWSLNHRVDSSLPGYLMVATRRATNDLSAMRAEALAELGMLLARAQRGLNEILEPEHLYISRYGHTAGLALHFHLIPICSWVKRSFLEDPRYRAVRDLSKRSSTDQTAGETDGSELTLFVWREFCESPNPPPISGPSIPEVVAKLRHFMAEPA